MTVFKGGEAIKEFLEEFDSWLSESVTVYLLGGSAMTVRGLKDQTEDIDLAVGVVSEFEHVYQTLTSQGFTVVDEPTESFEGVGKTVELHHDKRGFRIDIFEQQIVGKVWITDRMRDRAEEFWTGSFVTAFILSDEDMFLLKAVSGGDLASGRRRDIEDMRKYAQRGLDYELILTLRSTNSDRSIPARLKHGRFVIVRIPIHYRDGSKLTVGAPKQVHRSYRRVRDGVRGRIYRSGCC